MNKSGSNVFTVLVVGENPELLMEKYNMELEVERYLKYRYLDAEKMRLNSLKILNEMIKDPKKFNLNPLNIDYLKKQHSNIEKMSSFDYYNMITAGLFYDEQGDAWDNTNPNGKWNTFRIGRNLSLPFILKNKDESYSTLNKDIDWSKLHMANSELYSTVWKLIIDGETPKDDTEQSIYNNMKGYYNQISKFKNANDYINYNSSYWTYAILTENGWEDIDDNNNEIEWVNTFFDKYIKPLNENDKLTLFECSRLKD